MILNLNSILNSSIEKSNWRRFISKILGYVPKRYITLETIVTTVDEVTTYTSEFNTGTSSNAKITLIGDTTLTLTNLQNGFEGNIIVTNALADYSLAIVPIPYVVNDGEGNIYPTYAQDAVTILSYSYDGEELYINVEANYTKVS